MKCFVLLLVVVGVVVAEESILVDYHGRVGIPKAMMMKQAEAATDFDGARIVGGSTANLGEHPYMVGLLINLQSGHTSACGASLVSNTRLLTAAHCWTTRNYWGTSLVAVLGSTRLFSGGVRVNSNNVQVHSSYNNANLNNDVAVIVIPHVAYTNSIGAIVLPSGLLEHMTYAGERAVTAGYGRTSDTGSSDDQLRHVALTVIQNFECANIYGTSSVINSNICTSGMARQGPCTGDSGGPLVFTFSNVRYLIGITSFVADRGCEALLPAGYARTTSFLAWIRARL
ncbi:unnamed protein product [Leptidea sinapis]|uniref:Peptidase S1 domain-containing protein n=1 Tax=Leptidea sinapis TaxID=189913 RepID=A0A5E4PWT5_9NEOP|nr:unnamed protein product [Leptidea sinapis]